MRLSAYSRMEAMSLRASATVRPSPCALCMRVWLGLSFFLNLSSSTAPFALFLCTCVSLALAHSLFSPLSLLSRRRLSFSLSVCTTAALRSDSNMRILDVTSAIRYSPNRDAFRKSKILSRARGTSDAVRGSPRRAARRHIHEIIDPCAPLLIYLASNSYLSPNATRG